MSAMAQTTPPNCADIPGVVNAAAPPPVVYGLGGSAIAPLIAELGVQLYQAKALVVVYNSANGACSGPNALIGNTKITGTATYWASRNATTGLPVASTCQLAIAGDDADFGAANNSALSCPGITALPTDVGQFQGGASSANFIVPLDSLEQSISAAAAYLVYGFADVGGVAPWVNPAQIFRRDQNSFLTATLHDVLGIPANQVKGIDTLNNNNTITSVSTAPVGQRQATIGMVGGEVADQNRDKVKTLAYQHTGQTCGYWPDSSPNSYDKRNLRSGQYYLWNPEYFFAKVDAGHQVVDPEVAKFIGYLTSKVAPPSGIKSLDVELAANVVPKCAMQVWRDTDFGPQYSYAPPEPCGCYFEFKKTGSTSCTSCASTACTGGKVCRNSFCEDY
jgi:hypothetical protein